MKPEHLPTEDVERAAEALGLASVGWGYTPSKYWRGRAALVVAAYLTKPLPDDPAQVSAVQTRPGRVYGREDCPDELWPRFIRERLGGGIEQWCDRDGNWWHTPKEEA